MAISLSASTSTITLTEAEQAQIPSTSLPVQPQLTFLLQQFASLSVQLFSILSTGTNGVSTSHLTATIYAQLGQVDRKLATLLQIIARHQQSQKRIEHLVNELNSTEQSFQTFAHSLQTCSKTLQPILKSGAQDRKAIEAASAAQLVPSTILNYARLLAPFTSAPPQSLFDRRGKGELDPSGRGLPEGANPPFPTEDLMRRGRLQFGVQTSLGQAEEVGAHKEDKPLHEAPTALDAGARLAQQAKQSGISHEEEFSFDLDLNPDL